MKDALDREISEGDLVFYGVTDRACPLKHGSVTVALENRVKLKVATGSPSWRRDWVWISHPDRCVIVQGGATEKAIRNERLAERDRVNGGDQ